jgi:carbonic anhydrase
MHPDAAFVKTFEDGTSIELQPVQFHMHAPSEHTIDGRSYDLEVHIVHTNADG